MEVQFGPNAVDEPDLLYKLQRKIKVFNTNNSLPNRGYNLVASCSKYGIVFIIAPNCTLSAYYLKDLVDKDCEPKFVMLNLQGEPSHIAVNCDQEWLAVICKTMLYVYKIKDFQNQNISPSFSIKLEVDPSTFVSAVQWNPCITDTIAIVFFDGTLIIGQITTMQVKKLLSAARCICWSPKGKQIVTGNRDGSLCQYKPDLSPMKTIPPPKLFEGAPVESLAIYWISTYQFAVVYKNATDNSRPAVTIVNTPKGGQPFCYNYEDICYSLGANRPWYYYLHGLAQWNLILAASSNSMEIATLSSTDGANWLQWCQIDEARPELPLTNKKQENYPVGLSIDTCAIHQLPWGENETLPPMPLLHVVSQTGLLSIYNVINLKKEAAPLCAPPQQFILPANIMSSAIPDDVPQAAPVSQPVPQQIPQQPVQPPTVIQPQPKPQPAPPALNQINESLDNSKMQPFASFQAQAPQGLFSASTTQITGTKHIEEKPQISVPQNVALSAPTKPETVEILKAHSPIQSQEINAALKSEQERLNKIKANEELNNMLLKEINDFQMELYMFMEKTREAHIKLQQGLESIGSDFKLQGQDIVQLKMDCSIEELRESIVMLKLELVRACAVVAEARTHAEAKHLYEWSQADPLTAKRVASVKKLAYYVKNQLDQAHKALERKWNEMSTVNTVDKPGQRMLRPILDDIYQPLVKQQEILSRQEAVLRTLRNTLKECGDISPVFKSTSILRSTPFRNKADPLSKLTKNILNMSIDPEKDKTNKQKLSNQKLDALRDMLSNHKTVKIKPVNFELTQQLATMRLNYEKSLKEKEARENERNVQAAAKVVQKMPAKEPSTITATIPSDVKPVPKLEKSTIQPIKIPTVHPSYTPVSNVELIKPPMHSVARTLFTADPEPKPEPVKPSSNQQPGIFPIHSPIKTEPAKLPSNTGTVTNTTRGLLKDMLQNKSQANAEVKNDANTFMGQKICSPSPFNFSNTPATMSARAAVFPSNKQEPISFMAGLGSQSQNANNKSSETGEPEGVELPTKTLEEKPANAFILKSPTPLTTAQLQNVPDVLKSTKSLSISKSDEKVINKGEAKLKENIPQKDSDTPTISRELQKLGSDKNNETKPSNVNIKTTSSISITQAPAQPTPKPKEVKPEVTITKTEVPEKPSVFNSPSIDAKVAQPQAVSGASTTQAATIFQTDITPSTSANKVSEKKVEAVSTPSASSIFGTAVASQKSPTSDTKQPLTGSIFAVSSSSAMFGSSSIFGTSITTEKASTTTAKSIFSSAAKSTPFTPPTPVSTSVDPKTSISDPPVSTTPSITPPTTSSIFTTPQPSVFSSSAETAVTTQSLFAAPKSEPVFATTSSTQSIFNTPTPSPSLPVFGTVPTTAQSVFTSTATTTNSFWSSSSQNWGFANANQPVFGGATTQSSMFGTPTPTTQASMFGTPTQTSQSAFGSTTPTTQTSVFGTPSNTGSSSLFGGTESNLFAAATISTTKAASPSSGGSIFGTSSPGSLFTGGSTNVFGGKTTFGQSNQSAASIFGGANSTFKQNTSTNLWSGGNTSGNTFGSTGFGQQATTQASIFGGGTGGSFSAPSTGQPLGSPQPTAFGGGEAKSSIFGSPQQQTTPAFGGSPVFGSKPVFGQTASFGSPAFGTSSGFNKSPSGGFGGPATFGGAPSFGSSAFGGSSPGKVFGGTSPTPGFGSPTQSNSTFESLATQNTLTFGNLAQQSPPQPQPQTTFNTSPSFTGWRG
ncbi:nuclear pore complex protein Nup214 [Battus philenor]|uniref:nuclear pore complex protein Nup214 n=1 Tax=Battus philenor TaxID=42288 RepID=UPI0035CF6EE7